MILGLSWQRWLFVMIGSFVLVWGGAFALYVQTYEFVFHQRPVFFHPHVYVPESDAAMNSDPNYNSSTYQMPTYPD